jgi:hypothetical protein
MSSQGANSTTIPNGTQYSELLVRDASDFTRQVKERLLYTVYQRSSPPLVDKTFPVWDKSSIQFRLDVRTGKIKCGDCDGGNPYAGPN